MLIGNEFAITADHWTSIANDNYLGVTAHFIDSDWILRSPMLLCEKHEERQRGQDIIESIERAMDEFNLQKDLCQAWVTDTAANMNTMGILLERDPLNPPHHYCADHILELTTGLAFKDTDDTQNTLKAARSLVGHFKSSPTALASLKGYQKNDQVAPVSDPLGVIADVITRWWSTKQTTE